MAAGLVALLGTPVEGLQRLTGGASRETWAFRSGQREVILRRDPPGRPNPMGPMRREVEVMRCCRDAGLAVPEVVAFDEGGILGTPGLVMTRVAGETIARRILRDDAFATARTRLTGQCAQFLAGLHALGTEGLPSVEPLDAPRWFREAYEGVDDISPTFEFAFRRQAATRPAPQGPAVVHGDFRLGNLLVGPEGLTAVIDWELVHLGDPLEDLAWLCVKAWRYGAPGEVAGLGTIDELLTAYEEAGGRPVDRSAFHWWLVERTLHWGIMSMMQAAAHLTGATRSVELAAVGRRVAEQEADLLELLEPDAWAQARDEETPTPTDDDPGLYGRPTAAELLEAAQEYLSEPAAAGPGGAGPAPVPFHQRVTANVLGVVERQTRLSPIHEARHREGLTRLGFSSPAELAVAIRQGRLDDRHDELVAFLATTVRDRLAVANPKYLALTGHENKRN